MKSVLAVLILSGALGCTQTPTSESTAGDKSAAAPASADKAKVAADSEPPKAAVAVEARNGPLPIGSDVVMGDVPMKNIDGKMVSIEGVKAKMGTLVIFTCNHCPYVKAWEPRIAKLGNEAMKMGYGVVAINANDPTAYAEDSFDEMKARAAKLGFAFPYAVDATSNIARAFGATKTPEVFLFDASGKLAYYGAIDDNYRDAGQVEQHYLHDALKAVSAGQSVTKPVTKALGCSIKYREAA